MPRRVRGGGEFGGDERGGEQFAPNARALAFTCPIPQCKANGRRAERCRSRYKSVHNPIIKIKALTTARGFIGSPEP